MLIGEIFVTDHASWDDVIQNCCSKQMSHLHPLFIFSLHYENGIFNEASTLQVEEGSEPSVVTLGVLVVFLEFLWGSVDTVELIEVLHLKQNFLFD